MAEDPIDLLSSRLSADWPTIRAARARTPVAKAALSETIAPLVSAGDMSVVVFGSLARDELTSGSDTDWILLLDGQASSRHFDVTREIRKAIKELEGKPPGREATFGGFAVSHDILHRIGGEEDTNRNLTQRVLLLLESAALGPPDAHQRVIRAVLRRYITEDAGWYAHSVTVPRFLLNDIVRYWRTVAVDFAYKRRERAAEGWALRTLKLRVSRKLIFAAGMLMCFGCALDTSIQDSDDRSQALIEYLLSQVGSTPLERVAWMLLDLDLMEPARLLFGSYEEFLALLDDEDVRKRLESLSPEEAEDDELFQRGRSIGHEFQRGLDQIFFTENQTGIPALTQAYGVF